MNRPFDIVALAKRIEQRRREYSRLHSGAPVRITPAMSRILENDPDYVPYRQREAAKKQQPVRNPTVRTLVQIAATLGTTVGDLLGEPMPRPLAPMELAKLRAAIRTLEKII